MEQQVEREIDEDQHDRDAQRVLQRGEEDAALLVVAGAVLALAEAVDVLARADEAAQEQVGKVAQCDAEQRLRQHDEQDAFHARPAVAGERREHDGQHFIRRGEKDGEHRADGDRAGGKQRSGCAGDAALRDDAEQATERRACLAAETVQQPFVEAAAALKRLHEKIREEKNRNTPQAVLQAVQRGFADRGPEALLRGCGVEKQKLQTKNPFAKIDT